MNFEVLVQSISEIHKQTYTAASKAVNISLTCRNWLIGAYIHEYELHGQDRAEYGEKLFARLASNLTAGGTPNCNKSRLYRYRDFYRLYPHIVATLPPQFQHLLGFDEMLLVDSKVATLSPQSPEDTVEVVPPLAGHVVLERLSYSHIELLIEIDDPIKRSFYEIECIKGNWSVRELKRQIGSLYFERSGLSRNKKQRSEMANTVAQIAEPAKLSATSISSSFWDYVPGKCCLKVIWKPLYSVNYKISSSKRSRLLF